MILSPIAAGIGYIGAILIAIGLKITEENIGLVGTILIVLTILMLVFIWGLYVKKTTLALSVGLIGAVLIAICTWLIKESTGLFNAILIVPTILTLTSVWILYIKKASLPENASKTFLSIFIAFCYYMCVWIAVFGLSDYRLDRDPFSGVFTILTIPYFLTNIPLNFDGNLAIFPAVNATLTIITVLSIIITLAVGKKKIRYDKKALIYVLIFACLSGIAAFQHYDQRTKILDIDYQAERIEDEVHLLDYHPFSEGNLLKKLTEPATISFDENYPKLDGATAAYPVYGAMVQELYKVLDKKTVESYVTCSNTGGAYERLIDGKIDIFFGAQPSKQQIEAAKEKGVEFTLTPIGKEAFVFFVNKDNSVGSLTIEQLQDIYQKKIKNWKDVGGKNEKIMPFQRPENSGSQTIMLAMVMKDKTLPSPLWEEYVTGMGGIIIKVATYRNYSSSIGYSFRYFATGMKPNENIRLLAINGIEPTVENIRNGAYPFIIDVYAVTAGSTNENTEKLINWILSEQGQSFIELCGYVRK